MFSTRILPAWLAFVVFFAALPANACVQPLRPDYSPFVEADAVFVGAMVAHEQVDTEGNVPITLVTYCVVEPLKGDLPETVEVWMPGVNSAYRNVFVGAEQIAAGWYGASANRDGTDRRLSQANTPCAGPTPRIGATPDNVQIVKKWIARGRVDPEELWAQSRAGSGGRLDEQNASEEETLSWPDLLGRFVGAMVVFFTMLGTVGLVWLLRRF